MTASTSSSSTRTRIIIIGGGIIGLSTAYYLLSSPSSSEPKPHVTLIERHRIAHGASGRAMGMIGRDWQPAHTRPLSRLSWKCYEELDNEYGGGQWDWMVRPALGVEVQSGASLSAYRPVRKKGRDGDGGRGLNGEVYMMDSEVAYVNPAKFCKFLSGRCEELGLEVIYGTPTSVDRQARQLRVASPEGMAEVGWDKLLVCAGPWSRSVCQRLGLPLPAISNLPGHSVHIRPAPGGLDASLVGTTVFAGVEGESEPGDIVRHVESSPSSREGDKDCTGSIELIYRPDGLVYIAGENAGPRSASNIVQGFPDDPSAVEGLVDDRLVGRLTRAAARLSDALDVKNGAELVSAALCYRPVTPDGTPLLGRLESNEDEIYIAAGHGPWGITLGPGSGKVMADLLMGRPAPEVPLEAFSPSRFRP